MRTRFSTTRTIFCLGLLLTAMSASAQNDAPRDPGQLRATIQQNPSDPKLYIELGLAYWDRNDDRSAFEAFEKAVDVAPKSAEAHNFLGVALMKKADLAGAIKELRTAVSLDPKLIRAYANLGAALARSGDLPEAVTVFQKALALDPTSPGSHLNLGLALREKGDLKGALVHLRTVAKEQPKNAMVHYELGQTLRQAGDLAGSIAEFEQAIEINPELQEGYYGLGLALKQQAAARKPPATDVPNPALEKAQNAVTNGDLEAAKDQLLALVRSDEHNAEVHNLLGFVLGQQGDLEFARNHLQRAIELRPNYADAHYNYGVALWYSGSRVEAVSQLRESIRVDPSAGGSYAFLGMALLEMGEFSGARSALQRAIALQPPTTATYLDLGIVFLKTGELDRALGQFEAGLNAPSSVPAPDWDTAISKLREVLTKDSKNAEAHNILGLLLGRKGADSKEVAAEFRQAIELHPEYAQAHNNLGLVLAQSDEDKDAIAEFKQAIRIAPDYADAHANLGATLIDSDAEEAIKELERAVALKPGLVRAQFNLAEAYAASPSHGPAKQIEQLRKVVSLSPDFARAHVALGKALLREGNAKEAVSELKDATRLDPQSGEAHYQLGLALARTGSQSEATAEVQKGRELSAADERNQNAALDLSEGRAALERGEFAQATAKFQHAIKLQPSFAAGEHYLGIALEKQGDVPGASAAFEKAIELNPGDSFARAALDRLTLPDGPKSTTTELTENTRSNASLEDPREIKKYEGYIRDGRFAELEPLLTDYVARNPRSDWGWYALGYTQFAQKKLGSSIQSLAKSLQLNIANAEAHKILGRDLMLIGRFDAAKTEFEQGIRYDSASAELHYNLGKLYSMQDDWENARQEFEQAQRLDSFYAEAIDALGLSQEALGQDRSAVKSYEEAIALNEQRKGTFTSPYVNLSAYYNRTENSPRAVEYADKAIQLDGKCDPAWFQKARAAERGGDLQGAVAALNTAISLNPRASAYYYVLAGVYRKLGMKEDSKKALDMFSQLDRESNSLDKMRRSHSKSAQTAPSPGGKSDE
jgi:tetratricopeptide (TPR) repeat protein